MDNIQNSFLIIVEGGDEELFIKFFLKKILNIENVCIINAGGRDNIKNKIKAIINNKGFKVVEKMLIIRDADDSYETAYESIKNILQELKLAVPEKNSINFAEGKPKIGIFIMPHNNDSGMLEDLCMESIDKKESGCIDKFFECVGIEEVSSKAKVQVYLAGKKKIERNKLLGLGAKNDYWNFTSEVFKDLKSFLENLK